jgi:hypothetical protein
LGKVVIEKPPQHLWHIQQTSHQLHSLLFSIGDLEAAAGFLLAAKAKELGRILDQSTPGRSMSHLLGFCILLCLK